MAVYTVHGLRPDIYTARPGDRVVFIRDGFYFWAFAAGLIWLVWHRLWLALLGYIVVLIAVTFALALAGVFSGARLTVMLVISLLVGFEAASLWRWTLSRGKWRQLDIIVADDQEAAERRFFDHWTEQRPSGGAPDDRGAPPPVRDYAGLSRPVAPAASPAHDIIGLFPQPGAPR